MTIKLQAPAKINLALDVTGKLSNGYHTLSTIMQSISLFDIVTISESNTGLISVETSNSEIPSHKQNIAYKAAELFIQKTNIKHNGLNIIIQKNIPTEAGLGGGSTDAAAILIGLNHIFRTSFSSVELRDMSSYIGADVPFCIVGGTKICTGIGEIITEAPELEQCYIVIAKGYSGISTKIAFDKIDAVGFNFSPNFNKYNGSINSIKEIGYNRFESVTDDFNIKYIKSKMYEFDADYSSMTGSGSAVFGLFKNPTQAEKCAFFFNKNNYFSYLCTPITTGSCIIY